MEQRHKQINELITKIALGNPDITNEQITRARAMYNGDTRPLEEIEAELIAYSDSITANKKAAKVPKAGPVVAKEQPSTAEVHHESVSSLFNTTNSNVEELSLEKTMPIPSIIPIVEESHPDVSLESGDEMEAMFAEYKEHSVQDQQVKQDFQQVKENPKQLVKKQESPHPTINESGSGNVSGLLTVATILSIMTIVIAIFTIITS